MSNGKDQLQSMAYPNLDTPELLCDQLATAWESALSLHITISGQPSDVLLSVTESDEGSARILESLLYPVSAVPVVTSTASTLPGFVSNSTLVLACSSTGIDQDIIDRIDASLARNAYVICISTEGLVADFAREVEIHLHLVPYSFITHARNGYLFLPMLASLVRANLIDVQTPVLTDALTMLRERLARFAIESPPAQNDARALAETLADQFVLVIGASSSTEALAFHWYQQLARAGEWLVEWDTLPDFPQGGMAVSGRFRPEQLAAVLLRSDEDHPAIAKKFQDLRAGLTGRGVMVEEVRATGNSGLGRTLSLLVLGDYVGEYLKLIRQQKAIVRS